MKNTILNSLAIGCMLVLAQSCVAYVPPAYSGYPAYSYPTYAYPSYGHL